MLALPSQTPGLRAQVGITRAQADAEAWLFARDGRRWQGAAAVVQTLGELPGWRWVVPLYAWLPVRWAAARGYAWVVTHRAWLARWISTTPACERPGAACEDA